MTYLKDYFNKSTSLVRPYRFEIMGEVNILRDIVDTGTLSGTDVDLGDVKCIDLKKKKGRIIISEEIEDEELVLGKVIVTLWTRFPDKFMDTHLNEMIGDHSAECKLLTDRKLIDKKHIVFRDDSLIRNKLEKYIRMKNNLILQSFEV